MLLLFATVTASLHVPGTGIAGSRVGFNYQSVWVAAVLWWRVLLGAIIAFCMEVSEYYVVSCTSSLTFSIAGVAKEIATLSLAVYFFSEHLSTINQLGLLLCVSGIALHVYFKARANNVMATGTGVATSGHGRRTSSIHDDSLSPLLRENFSQDDDMELFTR